MRDGSLCVGSLAGGGMRVLLTVLSAQRSNLGERSTHVFDAAGGVIGRNAGCDWSLPDASNTLSSRHAAISHNGHGFVVTDTSTNGVYLNSVDTPIGRGQTAPLSNGDTLYISDYVISVALLKEPAQPAASPLYVPPPAPAPSFAAMPAQNHPSPVLSSLPPSTGQARAGVAARPGVDRIGLSMDDLLGPAPSRTVLPTLPAAPLPAVAPPVLPPQMSAPVVQAAPPPTPLIPDDFDFSDLMVPAGASGSPSVAAAASYDPSPPPPSAGAAAIPADFGQAAHQPSASPRPATASPALDGIALPNLPPQPAPVAQPAITPEPAVASPMDPLAMLRQRAIARAASIDLSRPNGEAVTQAPLPATPRPTIGAVAMPGGMSAEASSDGAVFWQALGLDAEAIPAASRQDMLAELGRAMRETASGLVAILSARKSLKEEFRIDQTRLAALENNPFKFFRSGDDALRRVIVEGKPGYLPLDRAVKQGFSDIQAHEVATVVAMQSALRKLLARMAPLAIEGSTEPGLLGRRPDKGRLWDRYVEAHGELSGDLDRTTREMLAEEFARAYAEQTKAGAAETGR